MQMIQAVTVRNTCDHCGGYRDIEQRKTATPEYWYTLTFGAAADAISQHFCKARCLSAFVAEATAEGTL